jgi:hypothetical protein
MICHVFLSEQEKYKQKMLIKMCYRISTSSIRYMKAIIMTRTTTKLRLSSVLIMYNNDGNSLKSLFIWTTEDPYFQSSLIRPFCSNLTKFVQFLMVI